MSIGQQQKEKKRMTTDTVDGQVELRIGKKNIS